MTKNTISVYEILKFFHSDHPTALQLTDTDKLVLLNLASHAGEKGIFPKVTTIAKETKKGYSTVKRSLTNLDQLGLIAKDYGRCKTISYTLKLSTDWLANELNKSLNGSLASHSMAHQRANERLTSEPYTINNKYNNKESKARTRRATPLCDDFELNEADVQKAKELGLTPDEANLELEKFFHHYQGDGIEKVDWHHVLQGWLVRAADYKKRQVNKSKKDDIKSTVQWYRPEHATNANEYLNGVLPNGLGSEE